MCKRWITGLILLLISNGVWAASFNCDKAVTKVEQMICADEDLSKKDEEMASLYKRAMEKIPNPQALKIEQRAWLKMRNRCRPEDIWKDPPRYGSHQIDAEDCLQYVYRDRISQMKIRYLSDVSNAIHILRTADDVENQNMDNPVCSRFLDSVRSGQGVDVISPVVENVARESSKLQKYLKGCDYLEKYKFSQIQEPRTLHGDRIMANTGQVWTVYNNYSLWLLTDENAPDRLLIYTGAEYSDISRSIETGQIQPHWSAGAGFVLLDKHACKRLGWISAESFRGTGWNAPPLTRQSELLRFDGGSYLLTVGNHAIPGNPPYYSLRLNSVENDSFISQCTYVVED